jgi:integrase
MSRGQGRVYRRKATNILWLDYSVDGERHRESSETTSMREAQDKLRKLIGDRKEGRIVGRPERVLLAEYEKDVEGRYVKDAEGEKKLVGGLRWLHETQYDLDELRSKERMQQAWEHIEAFFPAPTRVTAVSAVRLDEYARARLQSGAARQTVNNELSALRRAFNLAIDKGILATAPKIKLAKVENAREGFFEDDDFAAVLLELPAHLQPVIRFLRVTGWRVMEALGLTWDRVDWERQGIRLSARQTKGKKARLFPFGLAPDLKSVLEVAWQGRDSDGGFVFQRNGKPIAYTTLVHKWQAATKRASCEGRLIHDLRRTAARDFRTAGVDEGTIMALCGWKTRAMFDRYNIVNDADLAAAVAKRYNGTVAAQSEGSPAGPDQVSSSAA